MAFLKGLRVLDLASVGPAARATRILADYGMSVIKVAPVAAQGKKQIDPVYHAYGAGRGMQKIRVDLKADDGREVIRKLVAAVDVVIESYRPGVAARLGVGYDDLKAINPAIVYCSTSGYGQDGPYAQWAGHDINYLAMAGFLDCSGRDSEGRPAIPGATVADSAGGGMHAALAIVAALLNRFRHGEGAYLAVTDDGPGIPEQWRASIFEPFFRLALVLHRGRGDLSTLTAAETVDGYPGLRASGPAIGAATDACGAVLRLLEGTGPNEPAYNLLCRHLGLLDADPEGRLTTGAGMVAFRLKLALAAGFGPELAACAGCGSPGPVTGFSGPAGGVICAGCAAGSFPLSPEAHAFMVEAIGRPLAELPEADPGAVRQAGRAVGETLEHHAQVRLPRPEERQAA